MQQNDARLVLLANLCGKQQGQPIVVGEPPWIQYRRHAGSASLWLLDAGLRNCKPVYRSNHGAWKKRSSEHGCSDDRFRYIDKIEIVCL